MTTAATTAAKRNDTAPAFAPIHADLLDDLSRQADLVAIRNIRAGTDQERPARRRGWAWPRLVRPVLRAAAQ